MDITLGQVLVWLIVGALAGSLTGMVVKRRREGYGRFTNVGIGLVGALIGGALFDILHLDLGLGQLAISFEDLLSAFLGSLIFLAIVWLLRKRWKGKTP